MESIAGNMSLATKNGDEGYGSRTWKGSKHGKTDKASGVCGARGKFVTKTEAGEISRRRITNG